MDALLGEQTRSHADLDLAFDAAHEQALLQALGTDGFLLSLDERPARLVLVGPHGEQLDLHPVVFDAAGHGRQAGFGGATYPGGCTTGVTLVSTTVEFSEHWTPVGAVQRPEPDPVRVGHTC